MKEMFLREVRMEFGGSDLGELEESLRDYFLDLTSGELGEDEEVEKNLVTFLALNVLICEERIRTARDIHEKKAFESLKEQYESIFRVSGSTSAWVYTYCADQVDYYMFMGDEVMAQRWEEIAGAVARIILGETKLMGKVAGEGMF